MISLKSRITAVIVFMVLLGTGLVTLSALTLAQREMRAVVGDQQFALLSSAAAYIDADLKSRRTLLASVREELVASPAQTPQELQLMLETHSTLREEFFNVLVIDPHGKGLANLTDRRAVQTQDFSSRPYFVDTVRNREGVVSKPLRSSLSGKPIILVTEPVYDRDGSLRYILAGSIDLQRPRSFGQLSAVSIGASGYIFMVTADGTIIHHPDRTRILHKVTDEAGGAIPATSAALAGFEGWTEGRSKRGVPAVLTYKRLRETGWIVGSVFPADEAFKPLEEMRRRAMLAAAVVALVSGIAGWLAIMCLLRPLSALRGHISRIHAGSPNIDVLDVPANDEVGQLSQAFYRLSRQRREAEHAAATLARTDSLTGIPNRRMFEERLEMTVLGANRAGTWTGIAYLDIDHFKKINDTFGHAVGDAVLIEFAQRLTGAIRSTDTVARLAGDEFVIIFEFIAGDHCATSLALKIIDALVAPFLIAGEQLVVTSSIGIAIGAPGSSTADALLSGADGALYEAKRRGRNQYAIKELHGEAPVLH